MCGEWVFMCVCAGGRSSEEKEQVANRDPLCMQTRSFARARVHAHITLSCIIALHAKIIKNEMEIALILINRIARARSLAREDWIKKRKKKERKTIFQLLCAICFAIAIAHSSFFVWLLSSTLGSVHSFYRNQHRWNAADGACRWNYSTLRRVKCTQSDHASSTVDCAKRFFSCVLPISRNVNSIHSQPRPQMPPPPYCFCSTKALDTFNCFFTTNKNIECFFVVV